MKIRVIRGRSYFLFVLLRVVCGRIFFHAFALAIRGNRVDNTATVTMSIGIGGGIGMLVYSNPSNIFEKTGGIIYGSEAEVNDEDGIPLRNIAQSNNAGLGGGHAVMYDTGIGNANPRRNTTALGNQNLDNRISGSAGGWD